MISFPVLCLKQNDFQSRVCSDLLSPQCPNDSCPFPKTPFANAKSPHLQTRGRKESQNCPSLPPLSTWLTQATEVCGSQELQEEGSCPPHPGPGRVPGAQWAVGQQCGDTGGLSPGQSMTCAGSRAHLFLCAARSRLEEGTLLPPQPEVLGEPIGRTRLPSCRAGCLLGSKTDL